MLSSTPARQRSTLSQSRPPSSARSQATNRTIQVPELPEYEPPEAPLTAESLRKISTLLNSQHIRHLKTHLQNASEKLTDTAGDVNERMVDARVRYERKRQRQRDAAEDGEDQEPDSEERQQLDEREHKVQDVTGRLEEKMRQMIDSEARLQSLLDSVNKIEREEGEAQVAALGARQTRLQQRRQQRANREEEDEEDGDDERDETYEGTPEREARERNTQNPPSRRLEDSLEEGTGKWNELSLTERYVDIATGPPTHYCAGSLLMDLLQVRQQQHLHRVLPHGTRLQVPRRRGPAPTTLLYMVLAPGRYKCTSERRDSWQFRTTESQHAQPTRTLTGGLGRCCD